ncbi:MAG: prolipoprotein diacylglyceryl transferase [Ottowia sp.]|nr:prolipoprotein diacylglyceryl transferase [Ottowia sp.]
MLIHPQFDPVALHLGPLSIHWYGLMYLVAFLSFIYLGQRRIQQAHMRSWQRRDIDDLLFFGVLGVVLGGRLGYVLFYKPMDYLMHPLAIFKVWEGGMAFHGGLLGVCIAMAYYAYTRKRSWLAVTDFIAPMIPLGLAAGRLGNFINGELWGRASTLPWAMIFPQSGDLTPRHPSQLYQFTGEGLLLFFILWVYARTPRPLGAVSGAFLLGYGVLRFIAEFAREPDDFLGLLGFGWSMGQWLSLPMMLFGLLLMLRKHRD